MPRVTLQLLAGEFAICRLAPAEPVPAWAGSAVFSAGLRTRDELCVLCPAENVPVGVKHERGWRILALAGPFAFTETGILASVLTPLAAAGVSILAQSTFDTDYVWVPAGQLDAALQALAAAGHAIRR